MNTAYVYITYIQTSVNSLIVLTEERCWKIDTWYPKETGTFCDSDQGWIQSNDMSWQSFTSTFSITTGVRQEDALLSVLSDIVLDTVINKI